MKHIKKRISKIADELITYFFSVGANDITVNLQEKDDYFKIVFKSNYLLKNKEKIEHLTQYLKLEKQEEMEEYYWELTGDCDIDTELTLIGMMTDKCEIIFHGDHVEITLYKYKS